ncbi:MAG: dihydrodipicolinate reductase C-terminal domain-containing protein, partial [Bacteroidota bacterium]
VMYSSNFSVGVNVLFLLNQKLAQLMNSYPEYDVFIEEQHHRYKADAPSGTAVSLSKQVLEGLDRKDRIATDALLNRAPEPEELSVGYIRSGEIIGRHKVSYTSAIDEISIEHKAHNRRGFALGAVIAAEWMQGKKGFYSFTELFQ